MYFVKSIYFLDNIGISELTHLPYCRIYASVNWVSIGSDNDLSPIQHQGGLFSIGPLAEQISVKCLSK